MPHLFGRARIHAEEKTLSRGEMVSDLRPVHLDESFLLQFGNQRGDLLVCQLFLKRGADRSRKRCHRTGPSRAPLLKVRDDQRHPVRCSLWVRRLQDRNLSNSLYPTHPQFLFLKVFYERIEPRVPGDDVKIGGRLFRGQLAQVISDVKIEGIRPARRQAHVLRVCPHTLKRVSRFDSYFCLMMSDENDDTNMLVMQSGNVIGLHVLVIYKYVVRLHASSPFFATSIITERSGPTPGITRALTQDT